MTAGGGAAGVIVFSCPPRDCHGREGPKWLDQRVYHDREAELQARVDRRRVRLAHMAIGDLAGTLVAFNAFARDVAALGSAGSAGVDEADASCEREPLGSLENGA